MIKKIILLSFLLGNLTLVVQAQDTWSLERCIDYAQKNNIGVKQSQIQIGTADLTTQQSKAARYPGVNFSTNIGANFGRSINPSTNQFEISTIGFNSGSINVNQTIYDGGRINKSVQQANINREAAQADLEQTVQNISLNVASAYLQIVLAEEQLTAAKKRYDQSKQQLDQIEKLIAAGSRPANDKMDFIAQMARNEQALVSNQNTIDIGYLNLKQLLEIDPEVPFKIERPLLNPPSNNDVEGLTLRAVYNQAFSRQPQIKAGELRLRSAELDADIAKSDKMPTISAFGSVSSNYSTIADVQILKKKPISSGKIAVPTPFYTNLNGAPVTVFREVENYDRNQYKQNNYFSQIGNNFGQALGISIQIPIYDRGFTRIAVERARLGAMNQQLLNQRTQQQLKSDIQTALSNAKAAKKQLEAAEKTFNAAKGSYDNAEKKYKVGSATPFEITTARNNMDTAERDVIVAKYDYIFKLKIVDFYQGRKIILN
jgi:outer membrane protein